MEVHCTNCRRPISRQFLSRHFRGHRCQADKLALDLLARGMTPWPRYASLPPEIPMEKHATYVPRGHRRGRSLQTQMWVPVWALTIVNAWNRLGLSRPNRLGRLLRALVKLDDTSRQAIMDIASKGDGALMSTATKATEA